jgi:hypothetical protein
MITRSDQREFVGRKSEAPSAVCCLRNSNSEQLIGYIEKAGSPRRVLRGLHAAEGASLFRPTDLDCKRRLDAKVNRRQSSEPAFQDIDAVIPVTIDDFRSNMAIDLG